MEHVDLWSSDCVMGVNTHPQTPCWKPSLLALVPKAAAIQPLGWYLACTVDHGSVVLALQCMLHTLVPLGDHNST